MELPPKRMQELFWRYMKLDTDTEAAVKRDFESHSSNKNPQELREECRVFRLLAQAGLHTFRNMNHDVQNVVFELRQAMMKVGVDWCSGVVV
jgi:hypothetical protein